MAANEAKGAKCFLDPDDDDLCNICRSYLVCLPGADINDADDDAAE